MLYKRNIRVSAIIALGLVGSLFLFPFYMRVKYSGNLANINVLFYMSFLLLVILCRKINVDFKNGFLLMLLTLYSVIIDIFNGASREESLYSAIKYFIPLTFLLFEVKPDTVIGANLLKYLLMYFNFFVYTIFAIYVFDAFTNFTIMKFLTSTVIPGISSWIPTSSSAFTYRYASYMGHYLITAEIYMMYYLLNMSYRKIYNTPFVHPLVVHVIAVIGVLSTGSKVAIVSLLISLVGFNLKGKNKVRNLFLVCLLILCTYYIGFFDLISSRLNNELLTTGRNEVWIKILDSQQLHLHIFIGYGESISNILISLVGKSLAGVAEEYTFLILAYKFGVLSIVVYIFFLVLNPCLKAIKNKNYILAFSILIIFIEINMFNAYLFITDAVLLYVLFVVILQLMNTNSISKKNDS
ncbi:hypothetical protein ACFVHQ_01170 [Actinomycetes bacterium NPDC127524]